MSRLSSLRSYMPLLLERPLRSAAVAASNALAALFEGVAMVLLVPLIEMSTGGGVSARQGLVGWLVDVIRATFGELDIPTVVMIFAALAGLSAMMSYASVYLTFGFGSLVESDMRRRLFRALMTLTWPGLAGHKGGALAKALIQDSSQAGQGVVYLMFGFGAAISGATLLMVGALMSWQLTLTAILFTVAGLPFYMVLLRRGERSGTAASGIIEELSGHTVELIANAKLIFSLGLRRYAIDRFTRLSDAYCTETVRQSHQNALVRLVFEATGVIFISAFLLATLWWQQAQASVAIVFLMIFYRLAPRVANLQASVFRAATLGTWVAAWRELLVRTQAGANTPSGTALPTFEQGLALRGAGYAHADGHVLLRDVHLSIPRGSTVALVGPSGHGKSTLLDLLTGLNRPTGGEILVDGRPLHEMDVTAWQRRIGIVLQENPILHASVAENIAFAEDDVDQARLEEAARRAGAFDFIMAMPQGFATVLGERGARLSGGQRQRIALARALYRRPWLLLLDEVTSALDGESAAGLVASLSALRGEVTMVFVTHREDVLHLADTVYEIRDGMVRPCTAAQPR